ncbi:hypothetical protein L208DRAFT_1247084, partial [Tricholoma matsutake]
HCHCELIQEIWCLLLDEEFIKVYRHGIVLTCADGILQHIFLHIFMYSADFPEKVRLGTMHNKGDRICPWCTIPTANFDKLGLKVDTTGSRHYSEFQVNRAHDSIYSHRSLVNHTGIECMLKPMSLVPTVNTFAERLGPFGFNPYPMLVVDLMHEFELGVWKGTFMHIIWVLYAVPGGAICSAHTEVVNRFCLILAFGSDFQHFSNNVSGMKELAAQDFEDLLQVP